MTEIILIQDPAGQQFTHGENPVRVSVIPARRPGKRYTGVSLQGRLLDRTQTSLELTDAEQAVEEAREAVEVEAAASPETLALAIKGEAGRRIEAVYPVYKQRNMAAEATDYNDMRIGGATLDAAQELRATALRDAWTWIKAVRAASNTLEADVAAMDLAARQALDVTAAAHWPANPARPA